MIDDMAAKIGSRNSAAYSNQPGHKIVLLQCTIFSQCGQRRHRRYSTPILVPHFEQPDDGGNRGKDRITKLDCVFESAAS